MDCPIFIDGGGFRVTSTFGVREYHPITGEPNVMHYGIDIVPEPLIHPTRIKPIADGIVVKVKKDVQGYSTKEGETGGNYIYIQHADLMETRYKHLAYGSIPTHLDVGSYVSGSDHIGNMGATGRVTGAHVHFEVVDYKIKGTEFCLNPLAYLNKQKEIKGLEKAGGVYMGYIKLTKELKYGDKGEDVKLLQWRLCQLSAEIEAEVKSHSFKSNGTPDGGFGKGMQETLIKVQKLAGLPETGQLDKTTMDFLNSDFITLFRGQGKQDEIDSLKAIVNDLEREKANMESLNSSLQSELDSLKGQIISAKNAFKTIKDLFEV